MKTLLILFFVLFECAAFGQDIYVSSDTTFFTCQNSNIYIIGNGGNVNYSITFVPNEEDLIEPCDGELFVYLQVNGLSTTFLQPSITRNAVLTNFSGTYPYGSVSCECITPLPVEMSFFKAEQDNTLVRVMWRTLSEINSDYFLLQTSLDGHHYRTIDNVIAAGNSSSVVDYEVQHKSPVVGTNYYRLKQVDFDGQYKMYGLIAVDFLKKGLGLKITVFPNPTDGLLFIKTNLLSAEPFELYSFSGEHLSIGMLQPGMNTLQLHNKGLYVMQVKDKAFKIIVE